MRGCPPTRVAKEPSLLTVGIPVGPRTSRTTLLGPLRPLGPPEGRQGWCEGCRAVAGVSIRMEACRDAEVGRPPGSASPPAPEPGSAAPPVGVVVEADGDRRVSARGTGASERPPAAARPGRVRDVAPTSPEGPVRPGPSARHRREPPRPVAPRTPPLPDPGTPARARPTRVFLLLLGGDVEPPWGTPPAPETRREAPSPAVVV